MPDIDPTSAQLPALRVAPPAPNFGERAVVGVGTLFQAAAWGWAAFNLPWRPWTLFSILATLLAAASAGTAVSSVFAPRWFLVAWRATSWAALANWLWCTWIAVSSGVYLSALYGQLGDGIFAILMAIWGLTVLLTVPLAVWGLFRTERQLMAALRRVKALRQASAALALLYLGSLAVYSAQQHAASRAPVRSPEAKHQLDSLASAIPGLPEPNAPTPLSAKQPFTCKKPLETAAVTLLVSFVDANDAKPRTECKQGENLGAVIAALRKQFKNHAARSPIAIDVVETVADLDDAPSWLGALAVRPGLDGVCVGKRCFAPWQLLGRGAFVDQTPVRFLPDFKFGVSHKRLQKWLKGSDEDAYQRIATQSFVIEPNGTLSELRRLHALDEPFTDAAIERSERAFESHILAAQQEDGKFRYTLDPFSGKADTRTFSLARQAGTAYALCDVGRATPEVTDAARKALQFVVGFLEASDDKTLLGLQMPREKLVSLGPSALGLIAFLRCRSRLGSLYDDQIRGLARLVIRSHTADGFFEPSMRLVDQTPRPGAMQLYAQGQAILALVMLEAELIREPSLLPELAPNLSEHVERAMNYVAGDYWQRAMQPFFFLEENWHCLAARAALEHHRHAAYERFCLDYVRFKTRMILEASSEVDPEMVGGFGIGNVFPAHSAGAAGFGEALAAALTVERARGESYLKERRVMESIVQFVLRQQWMQVNTFGCVETAIGGFPEQVHSPVTRIDFAQHAWSAVAHARTELAW